MYKTVFANSKKVYVSLVYKLGFVLKLGKKHSKATRTRYVTAMNLTVVIKRGSIIKQLQGYPEQMVSFMSVGF